MQLLLELVWSLEVGDGHLLLAQEVLAWNNATARQPEFYQGYNGFIGINEKQHDNYSATGEVSEV